MIIVKNDYLRNFNFWSGAADTVKYLSDSQMDQIECELESIYPDGMDETDINDFFWFERDTIANWLGYDDFEELMEA